MLTINQISTNYYINKYNRQPNFKAAQGNPTTGTNDVYYQKMDEIMHDINAARQNTPEPKSKPSFAENLINFLRKINPFSHGKIQNSSNTQIAGQEPEKLNADRNGWTTLHYLCKEGDRKAVKAFLEKHKNLDMCQLTNDGDSYVKIAIDNEHKDIANLLVDMKNYDPSVKNQIERTDVYYLIKAGYKKPLKKIFKRFTELDMNQTDYNDYSYMKTAISYKRQDIAMMIADMKNYDPTAQKKHITSDFRLLINAEYKNVIKKILKRFSDMNMNQMTDSNVSYMQMAINKDCEDIALLFADMKNYDPTIKDKYGWTDMHYLFSAGFVKTIKKLLEKHPNLDMNLLTSNGESYMSLAKYDKKKELIKLIAKHM